MISPYFKGTSVHFENRFPPDLNDTMNKKHVYIDTFMICLYIHITKINIYVYKHTSLFTYAFNLLENSNLGHIHQVYFAVEMEDSNTSDSVPEKEIIPNEKNGLRSMHDNPPKNDPY